MLDKDLIKFLKELKENNNKEWFDSNRKRYQFIRNNLMDFISLLILELSKLEPSLKNLEPKDCLFRINRDIRFSPDKTPYKTNMGAYIAPGGKKAMRPGYYLHIEPDGCFAAGGMYMPPAAELKAIRSEILYNPDEYLSITGDSKFKKTFGKVNGESLKTAPKGFPKDDKNIDLVKLKSYTVITSIPDSSLLKQDSIEKLMEIYKVMQPLNRFLARALEE